MDWGLILIGVGWGFGLFGLGILGWLEWRRFLMRFVRGMNRGATGDWPSDPAGEELGEPQLRRRAAR